MDKAKRKVNRASLEWHKIRRRTKNTLSHYMNMGNTAAAKRGIFLCNRALDQMKQTKPPRFTDSTERNNGH